MNKIILPIIFVTVIGLFGFDLIEGLRTGNMRFRLRPSLQAGASKADDARGFWTYALFNLCGIAFAAFALIFRSGLQGI